MIDFAKQICTKLGIPIDLVLKRPIRGLPGVVTVNLITALISTDSVKAAASMLGYTENPIKQCIREVLHPVFPDRSNSFGKGYVGESWKTTLLLEIGLKECNSCLEILSIEDFKARARNFTGIGAYCRNCVKLAKVKDRYYISERTPEWSDLSLIATFYSNCPKDYHVDHIIPLRGANVSGLHIINNLQYLPAMDNIRKNNCFDIDTFVGP